MGSGVWASGPLFGCLIWCFVLILCLCVFFEILKCQLVNSEQKTFNFCYNCMAVAL